MLNELEQSLLNDYQRDFPLISRPFQRIAEQTGKDENTVLACLQDLSECGVISRVGPVFRPNTIGSSTLAAVSVPAARLTGVAARISEFSEVNHNYEREHHFNLWFVVNAATVLRRDAVLDEIRQRIGLPVISLPMIRDYRVDLGFQLDFSDTSLDRTRPAVRAPERQAEAEILPPNGDRSLIEVLQRGLPLIPRPYAGVGASTGLGESVVLERVRNLIDSGKIKRFGVVVRHHELGYRANAMCVWNIPDGQTEKTGRRLAMLPQVTLCYERPRRLPEWPYNLFCMIHGKDRGAVSSEALQITRQFKLEKVDHAVLFSRKRFKQTGADYRSSAHPDASSAGVGHG